MNSPVAVAHKIGYEKAYETGLNLYENQNEWAAVCFFYAAYRAARCAFANDERLSSDAKARAVHPKLSAGSRHVEFHNGYRRDNLGVNDIVRHLYPEIGTEYLLLHTKSCEVRYREGLVGVTLKDTKELADVFLDGLKKRNLI